MFLTESIVKQLNILSAFSGIEMIKKYLFCAKNMLVSLYENSNPSLMLSKTSFHRFIFNRRY